MNIVELKENKISSLRVDLDGSKPKIPHEVLTEYQHALENNTSLTWLDISAQILPTMKKRCLKLLNATLRGLKANTGVINLHIILPYLEDDTYELLKDVFLENKSIRYLRLSSINFTGDMFKFLTKSLKTSSVKSFHLYKIRLSDSDCRSLSSLMKYLEELDLVETTFGVHVGRGIRNSKTLISLELAGVNLKMGEIDRIGEALTVNDTLEYFKYNGFHGVLDPIFDSLKHNKGLLTVSMSEGYITNQGIESLSDALRQNTTLLDLSIYNILRTGRVYTDPFESVAESLRYNQTLLSFKMRYPYHITKNVMDALTVSLKQNTTLKQFMWGTERLSMDTLEFLHDVADIISSNSTLEQYNPGSLINYDDEEGYEKILEALGSNYSLTSFHLSSLFANPYANHYDSLFKKILQRNSENIWNKNITLFELLLRKV